MSNNTQKSVLSFPPIIFGTSGLGNLYIALEETVKQEIVRECFLQSKKPVVFDSAGKYGAGLALESLGNSLRALKIKHGEVVISNKLGWVRTELKTAEPTFEPEVWKGLQYDAVQKISYHGILECFEQGIELLGGYVPQLVSVHDPDEYMAKATNDAEAEKLYNDILDAYTALSELKAQGKVTAIGVGAKSWNIIKRLSKDVKLDWVMIANSMTVMNHPQDLWNFMQKLSNDGVKIFNSAVFQAGFLIGGDYYNYKLIKTDTIENQYLFKWREDFFSVCREFNVKPAAACVQFGLSAPGVVSVALSSTNPERVKENVHIANVQIPAGFWETMKAKGLINKNISFNI